MTKPMTTPPADKPKLTCAFGSPWKSDPWGCGPCQQCQAYSAELEKQFWQDVLWGKYDAHGYTPADRRAAVKAEQLRKGEAA